MKRPRPIVRTLRWLIPIGLLIAGLAISLSGSRQSRVAPALPSERLAGPPATLRSLEPRSGHRRSLILFWASWCGPCASEAPAVERFASSPSGRGRIVAVDWSDPVLADARAFIARYRWTFPVLRDAEGLVGNRYGLSDLPTTYVIDASGHIRAILRGPQSEASLERALSGEV